MSNTELTFVEEEIPTITREGGSGAKPIEWEAILAPLTEEDKAGRSFRVWQYAKKTGATSRVASVRNRLTEVVPEQNWKIAVRVVPGSDPEMFGVYVQYNGTFTPEQVAERATERQKRIDRIKAARKAADEAKAALEGASGEGVDPGPVNGTPAAPSTPAAKVAAARKAATGK